MPRSFRTAQATALLALAACAGGADQDDGSTPGRARRPDVLVLLIDTLRADRLGCYGYAKATPTIDALASRSVVFDSLFTTSSTTLPAHASLLTGRDPGGLRNGYTVSYSAVTLAEVLSREGYEITFHRMPKRRWRTTTERGATKPRARRSRVGRSSMRRRARD